jgi:hypothetical protein
MHPHVRRLNMSLISSLVCTLLFVTSDEKSDHHDVVSHHPGPSSRPRLGSFTSHSSESHLIRRTPAPQKDDINRSGPADFGRLRGATTAPPLKSPDRRYSLAATSSSPPLAVHAHSTQNSANLAAQSAPPPNPHHLPSSTLTSITRPATPPAEVSQHRDDDDSPASSVSQQPTFHQFEG